MSKLFLVFTLAWHTLKLNLSRTLLTIVGITVGIALVVIVLSAGRGLRGIIMGQISGFGNNWIDVEVKIPEAGKASQQNASGLAQGVTITTLTEGDMAAIKKVPNIKDAYAAISSQAVLSYGNQTYRPMIFGVSASYIRISGDKLERGRFYTQEEDREAQSVVVLGKDAAINLFGNNNPLLKYVHINNKNYQVIGVMEELGTSGFMDMDTMVYIPLRTVQKKIMGVDHVLWIIGEMENMQKAQNTAEEITALMRERHKIFDSSKDDFAVTTMAEAVEIVGTIIFGVSALLVALSAISLIVGGVGIMNVMYVSVAERTFEIGLRKSAGATTSDILWQFLIEAVVLTGLGGVLGIIIGISFSFFVSLIANALEFSWEFGISVFSLILSTGFSILVGVLFGLYPAKKAASLDPMAAIRQE